MAVCICGGRVFWLGNYLGVGGGNFRGGDGVAGGVGISWLGNDICRGANARGIGVSYRFGNDI